MKNNIIKLDFRQSAQKKIKESQSLAELQTDSFLPHQVRLLSGLFHSAYKLGSLDTFTSRDSGGISRFVFSGTRGNKQTEIVFAKVLVPPYEENRPLHASYYCNLHEELIGQTTTNRSSRSIAAGVLSFDRAFLLFKKELDFLKGDSPGSNLNIIPFPGK